MQIWDVGMNLLQCLGGGLWGFGPDRPGSHGQGGQGSSWSELAFGGWQEGVGVSWTGEAVGQKRRGLHPQLQQPQVTAARKLSKGRLPP